MNFDLSEEQQMLVDSIGKFLKNDYDFDLRRKLAKSELGFSRDNWKTYAELGWLSVPFSADNGGFGGSTVDLMLMHEQFGKAMVVEPLVPTLILGGRLIELLGNAEQKETLLSAVIQGELQLALASNERIARNNPAIVGTTATAAGSDYVLNGEKIVVLNGAAADKLLVTARTSGGDGTSASIGVEMNMSLYAGGAIQNQVREALALVERSRQELDQARRGTALSVRQAFLAVQSGLAQVKAYEAAESSARLALEATQLGYRVGVRINKDVLDAQTQLTSTQKDLYKARYDVIVGSVRLRQASGSLSAEDVSALNKLLAN